MVTFLAWIGVDLGILVILVSNLLGATTVLMVLYFWEQLVWGVATIDWILKLLSPDDESSHFRFFFFGS